MAIDETPKVRPATPVGGTIGNDKPVDDIVSVNDRGRRQGGAVGPFFAIGGVALVVLIGGLLTVKIAKDKLSGPKPQASATAASAAGLSKSFDSDSSQPPLPGAQTNQPSAIGAVVPSCPDGSAGNELKSQDGTVVRNAAGQGVRVCPNGQVIGVTAAQEAQAKPIPVEPATPRSVTGSAIHTATQMLARGSDGQMMLNDGKYGSAPVVPDLTNPQAVLGAVQQAANAAQPKTEGLLTSAPAGSLEAELIPSKTPLVQAARIADLNLLLPKGHTIDCGMSMRIISSLAGQASCTVTKNVYSANGKVVLIERGSEAVGEYRSGASIGQKRLFVLWNRIITPGGIVINLDSPGADELGSTGLTGTVDDHWWERVGSAFLLSTVQDAIQYKVAEEQAKSGGQTLVLTNTAQTGNSMAEKVLDSTINIPPTIYKNQGDRAVIYVARDLDFSSVYRLRSRP